MTQEIYVMRVWHGSRDSESWRVTITDTRTEQKYNFANLDKLVAFFKERLEADKTKPLQNHEARLPP